MFFANLVLLSGGGREPASHGEGLHQNSPFSTPHCHHPSSGCQGDLSAGGVLTCLEFQSCCEDYFKVKTFEIGQVQKEVFSELPSSD